METTAPALAGTGPDWPRQGPLRLATFAPSAGEAPRVGALTPDDRVVDLGEASARLGCRLPFDPARMLALIEAGPEAVRAVRGLLAAGPDAAPLASVRLLAPIPRPTRNLFAVGWNYVEHFEEGKGLRDPDQKLPEHPVFFTKGVNAVSGPYDPIPYDPRVSTEIDWECELLVVIGTRGKNVPEDEALSRVFGYAAVNDVSARDVQHRRHGGQWFKGKSLDGHAPTGPWIVTAEGFDATDLRLVTRVNGVVKQDGRTRQMHFPVPRLIAELSLGLTLEPGDLLSTGTPIGIGYARTPKEFLKPGDHLETEIEGIGTLRNPVLAL